MSSSESDGKIKFMTYNIWSNEHVAVYRRMQSISDLIVRHDPDVFFLQEVTRYTLKVLERSPWWRRYSLQDFHREDKEENHFCVLLSKFYAEESTSVSEFRKRWIPDHPEPRSLVSAFLDLKRGFMDTNTNRNTSAWGKYWPVIWDRCVRVASCRLPGPTPEDARCMDRLDGRSTFFKYSCEREDCNVVLAADMSWDEDLDGPGPYTNVGQSVWVDAWCELRGGEDAGGWTYDVVANPMLKGRKPERKRPDRFFCKLRDFTLDSIEIIGVDAIPGLTYTDDKGNVVPVLPSHHFGLVLTIAPKKN